MPELTGLCKVGQNPSTVMGTHHCRLSQTLPLLLRATQTVNGFGVQLPFHMGAGSLKTVFYIYLQFIFVYLSLALNINKK